eukprot:SAG31_NODE_4115_length_3570_cov_35.497551_1_plen_339_part_00
MADAPDGSGPPPTGAENAQPAAAAASRRYTGRVARWNGQKGFGFIEPDDKTESDADIFVHQSELQADGYRSLADGELVEYEHITGDDGRRKAGKVTGPNGGPLSGPWGDERPDKGVVSRWRDDKGFGFITPDAGGADIFVHQSCIFSTGYRALTQGEPVEYTLQTGDDGRVKAAKVCGPGGAPLKGGDESGKGKGKGMGGGYDDYRGGGRGGSGYDRHDGRGGGGSRYEPYGSDRGGRGYGGGGGYDRGGYDRGGHDRGESAGYERERGGGGDYAGGYRGSSGGGYRDSDAGYSRGGGRGGYSSGGGSDYPGGYGGGGSDYRDGGGGYDRGGKGGGRF